MQRPDMQPARGRSMPGIAAAMAILCCAVLGPTHETFAAASYTTGSSALAPTDAKAEFADTIAREITTRFRLLSPTQLQVTTSFLYAEKPADGVITEVYLLDEQKLLDSIAGITTSDPEKFQFQPLATPPQLPSAKQYDDLSYEAVKGGWSGTGLKPGGVANSLTVTVNLNNPLTDEALYSLLVTRKLATGYVVRSLNYTGNGESFVSDSVYKVIPNSEGFVPEPGAVLLFAMGLGMLAIARRTAARRWMATAMLAAAVAAAGAAQATPAPSPHRFEFIPGAEMPARQRQFVEILESGRQAYDNAHTKLQRTAARLRMQSQVADFMAESQDATGWIASIKDIRWTREGDGVLVVAIAPNVILSTFGTHARDQESLTLIRKYSPMAEALHQMSLGDPIVVDAKILICDVSDDDDMMHRPFFVVRFKSVRPLRPDRQQVGSLAQ